MSEQDVLRVDSSGNQGGVISSHKINSVQAKKTVRRNSTVFSLIKDETEKRQDDEMKTGNMREMSEEIKKPKLMLSFSAFFVSVIVATLMFVFAYTSSSLMAVPIVNILLSLAVPLGSLIFFYSLNTRKNVAFFTIFMLILVGIICSIACRIISEWILDVLISAGYISSVLGALTEVLLIIFSVTFACKVLKLRDYLSIFLISCCIGVGYALADTGIELFTSMFIRVEIVSNKAPLASGAILNAPAFWKNSLENLLKSAPYYAVVRPLVIISCSVIGGFAVNYNGLESFEKKSNVISVYLLLILSCILTVVMRLDVSVEILNVTYKIIGVITALVATYKIVNYALSKEKFID